MLVVDDEEAIRYAVRDFLEANGFAVEEAEDCNHALSEFMRVRPDLVLLDYQLPDGTALDLLPRFQAVDADVPVILLTAHGSIDLAVRAIKDGAEQFLTKPVELPAVLLVLERILEHQRNRRRARARRTRDAKDLYDPFVGLSAAIRNLARLAERVADSDSPLLLLGETGVGKGVLARWLHAQSARRDDAFVDLNCAGLSRELLDSELFGHERGAFTGAVKEKDGLLEMANGGTVFLDEIGDMDPAVQAKLLKVLEEHRFRRLGEVRDRRIDIRLIAATHRDLQLLTQNGSFRSDLYFRINTVQLELPALRDRREDIPLLAGTILERLGSDLGRPPPSLAASAIEALEAYDWPGNIRELRNVLERALLLADSDVLSERDLHFQGGGRAGVGPRLDGLTLEKAEIACIEGALRREGGRVQAAAERLDVPKSTLYQKLKAYGIDPSRFRNRGPDPGNHSVG